MQQGAVLGCLLSTIMQTLHTPTNCATTIDGRAIAETIKGEIRRELDAMRAKHNLRLCLAVVRVGSDPASIVYVRNKLRTSEELGFASEHHALPSETTTGELLDLINNLNEREEVDGILVQLPLPPQIDEEKILTGIDPEKDVDGFHPLNIGRLVRGETALAPCTPAGIMELLDGNGCEIAGRHACIVGRSHIVGRPLAALLLQRDATITICHSRTKNLAALTSLADILVVAVGRINLIRGANIKSGATVIDVGMNSLTDSDLVDDLFPANEAEERRKLIERKGSTLVGDVNRREVEAVAGWLTPVPGGVGPMTIAMLMKNTLTAAVRRRNL